MTQRTLPARHSPHGTAPQRRRRPTRGFTLIETLLVLTILGTVAAIAVPRYLAATHRYHARAAAHQLALELDMAQQAARQQSRTVTVTFDPAANTIAIDPLADPNDPDQPYLRRLDARPYDVKLIEADFDGQPQISFDAFAQLSAAGSITIASANTRKRITLNPSAPTEIQRD